MIRSYSGNTRPFALVLCADDAAEKSEQLMRLISEKGTSLCVENGGRPCKDKAKRAYAVIALLTKGFADSKNLQDALFEADSAGKAIIPIHLDDHSQSEEVNRILFARNALFAENYSGPEELAQRVYAGSVLEHPFITEAQKKARRKTLGAIITAAAAVAIAAGLTISGMIKNRPDSADIKPDVPDVFDELTSEQLQKITNVVMLGDSFFYSTYEEPPIGDRFSYAHDGPEEDGETYGYFSHEDGSRIENKHYDDLSFLAQLPNLKNLQLVCIDSPAFPDLTGCMALHDVAVCNCTMTDLSAIAGTGIREFESSRTPIESFAPLTQCSNLQSVQIDLYQQTGSFEGFGPEKLGSLSIVNGDHLQSIDLSGLENCGRMTTLDLERIPLTDIGFAANMPLLKELYLENIDGITDVNSLESCTVLERVIFQDLDNLRDISVLGKLEKLKEVAAHCPISNLDFLKEMPTPDNFSLHFSRPMTDYSGLAAVNSFGYLHCNLSGGSYDLVSDYLENKKIDSLTIYDTNNIDLSKIPDVKKLEISDCNITDLKSLKNISAYRLSLVRLQYLRSLDGIEALTSLDELDIRQCPRLSDYDAISNIGPLQRLTLDQMISLPDFSKFNFAKRYYLTIGSIYGIDSLDFPGQMNDETAGYSCRELDISGLDQVTDLSPLNRLNGWKLIVPPQLADQAEDMVESGNFHEYEIRYPDGAWDEINIEIISLEDLETFPAALLEKAEYFMICGNDVNGRDWYGFDNNGNAYFRDEQGNNLGPAGDGLLTDLTALSVLTGLRDMNIHLQSSLTSMEGIQSLQQLETLRIGNCRKLNDISAAFTLGGLRELELTGCSSISSIEGIENLYSLETIRLAWNDGLGDLTPLTKLPNLKQLIIKSQDQIMNNAVSGLEGMEYGFEIIIEE